MNIGGVGINWFDFAVVIVIAVGIERGRRRGMSGELLDMLGSVITVVGAALAYRPVGIFVDDATHIGRVTCFVMAYLLILLTVRVFFGWMKRMVGEKLVNTDVFGAWEYYLGMIAGGVRFTCYLVMALALFNAVYCSPDKLAAQARMQKENFGDISFPTLATIQQNVFVGSASGRFAKEHLGQELIVATAADRIAKPGETLARRQDRVLNEILDGKK